jgi:hypothetical protein
MTSFAVHPGTVKLLIELLACTDVQRPARDVANATGKKKKAAKIAMSQMRQMMPTKATAMKFAALLQGHLVARARQRLSGAGHLSGDRRDHFTRHQQLDDDHSTRLFIDLRRDRESEPGQRAYALDLAAFSDGEFLDHPKVDEGQIVIVDV